MTVIVAFHLSMLGGSGFFGLTTKPGVLTEALDKLVGFVPLPDLVHWLKAVKDVSFEAFKAGEANDAVWLEDKLLELIPEMKVVIPSKPSLMKRKNRDVELWKLRRLVENFTGKVKKKWRNRDEIRQEQQQLRVPLALREDAGNTEMLSTGSKYGSMSILMDRIGVLTQEGWSMPAYHDRDGGEPESGPHTSIDYAAVRSRLRRWTRYRTSIEYYAAWIRNLLAVSKKIQANPGSLVAHCARSRFVELMRVPSRHKQDTARGLEREAPRVRIPDASFGFDSGEGRIPVPRPCHRRADCEISVRFGLALVLRLAFERTSALMSNSIHWVCGNQSKPGFSAPPRYSLEPRTRRLPRDSVSRLNHLWKVGESRNGVRERRSNIVFGLVEKRPGRGGRFSCLGVSREISLPCVSEVSDSNRQFQFRSARAHSPVELGDCAEISIFGDGLENAEWRAHLQALETEWSSRCESRCGNEKNGSGRASWAPANSRDLDEETFLGTAESPSSDFGQTTNSDADGHSSSLGICSLISPDRRCHCLNGSIIHNHKCGRYQ